MIGSTSEPQYDHPRLELWSTDIARVSDGRVAKLARLLDDDERERARRLRNPEARQALIVGRGLLRVLLARRLGVGAKEVQFVREALGRPRLAAPTTGEDVRFSVSHSGNLVLHAFAPQHWVGVDVERVRERPGLLAIADRFFAPAEQRALHRLPADQRIAGFFTLWTQKEAYLKALGVGLSQPLDAVEVSMTVGPLRLLARDAHGKRMAWSLMTFSPAPGYTAAVAVEAGPYEPQPPM